MLQEHDEWVTPEGYCITIFDLLMGIKAPSHGGTVKEGAPLFAGVSKHWRWNDRHTLLLTVYPQFFKRASNIVAGLLPCLKYKLTRWAESNLLDDKSKLAAVNALKCSFPPHAIKYGWKASWDPERAEAVNEADLQIRRVAQHLTNNLGIPEEFLVRMGPQEEEQSRGSATTTSTYEFSLSNTGLKQTPNQAAAGRPPIGGRRPPPAPAQDQARAPAPSAPATIMFEQPASTRGTQAQPAPPTAAQLQHAMSILSLAQAHGMQFPTAYTVPNSMDRANNPTHPRAPETSSRRAAGR